MGLSLDGLTPATDPRRGCVIGKRLLPLLSDKDKAKFYELLADRRFSDASLGRQLTAQVEAELGSGGFEINHQHLQRHRAGTCGCGDAGLR